MTGTTSPIRFIIIIIIILLMFRQQIKQIFLSILRGKCIRSDESFTLSLFSLSLPLFLVCMLCKVIKAVPAHTHTTQTHGQLCVNIKIQRNNVENSLKSAFITYLQGTLIRYLFLNGIFFRG